MAKALRQRVGNQYKGTQRTRKAVHGECSVELAKWTFPIISLCREPYEAKVSRTGLTGGMGRRTVRQRALCLPSKTVYMMGKRRKRTPQRQSEAGFLCDRTTEVREMRTADTILNIIQDRGKRKLPLDDVYRQLYNPAMYLRSYAKLYKNQGAMTPGITEETVDGMSREKIAKMIEAIRYERWQWTPVRRILKEKPKGGKRPLGMPTWSDKVVQDIIRSILEAYYEPQFSDHSHGFRPHRGCQTALTEIHN